MHIVHNYNFTILGSSKFARQIVANFWGGKFSANPGEKIERKIKETKLILNIGQLEQMVNHRYLFVRFLCPTKEKIGSVGSQT